MSRQTRSRRRAKRIGLVLCAATLALWELSIWCECTYGTSDWGIGVGRGITWVAWRHPGAPPWEAGLHFRSDLHFVERFLPEIRHSRSATSLLIPFSVLFVLFAIPTAYLCWRDRRRRVSRLSRGQRVWKWLGTATCVVIVSVMVVSVHGWLFVQRGCHFVGARFGAIEVEYAHGVDDPPYPPPRLFFSWTSTSSVATRWHFIREHMFWPGRRSLTYDWSFHIPLWMPLLLIAIPTGVLWWRDRRPSPGYCQTCGYNLTGNTSGRCPECGTPTASVAPRK